MTGPRPEDLPQALQPLLQQGQVWTAARAQAMPRGVWNSGFAALDAALPGGGWPRQGLVECFAAATGIGEISLFQPVLRAAGRCCWLAPPLIPYAPALQQWGLDLRQQLWVQPKAEERLWAAETVAQSGAYPVLLAWLEQASPAQLRRLSLAAEEQGVLLLAFRPERATSQASPARLRLRLQQQQGALQVNLFKGRGLRPQQVCLQPERADVVALSARTRAGSGLSDRGQAAA